MFSCGLVIVTVAYLMLHNSTYFGNVMSRMNYFIQSELLPEWRAETTYCQNYRHESPKSHSIWLLKYSYRFFHLIQAAPQMLRQQKTSSATFLSRLVGADRQTFLRPITSPYTARVLKPFIRRDFESRPLKLRLLNEILAYKQRLEDLAYRRWWWLVLRWLFMMVCQLISLPNMQGFL